MTNSNNTIVAENNEVKQQPKREAPLQQFGFQLTNGQIFFVSAHNESEAAKIMREWLYD